MKRFLSIIVTLVLAGAGCTTNLVTQSTDDWRLSFDLPDSWIMTEGCVLDAEHVGCGRHIVDVPTPALDTDIDPIAETIWLQNTAKLPLFGGIAPEAKKEDLYQQEDVAVIMVSLRDQDAPYAPAQGGGFGSEDLGDGFQKIQICDLVENPECEIYGGWAYQYLYTAPSTEQYIFTVTSLGVDHDVIEEIILSATE